MSYKPNFIKRERVDSKIPTIKDAYDRIKGTPDKLRKNEPFVLMFRNFIFFDVKSYECRNGDLYIRNIVDGIVLKRYFRMDAEDQLTVFKNREEFDVFMKKVTTKSSDEFVLENYSARRDSVTGEIDLITSAWDGVSFTRDEDPDFFDKIVKALEANPDKAQILTKNDFM